MFKFQRTYIGDTFISETNSHIKECKLLHVSDANGRVGKFYSGANFSFIEFEKDKYRIDYIPKLLRMPTYRLVHAHTDEEIGHYEIPNVVWLYLEDSFLYLKSYTPLKMAQNTSHRKLFKSQTRKQYTFELTSQELQIVYKGEVSPAMWPGSILEDQVFEGTIHSSSPDALLPLFAGLHIIEENFRRIENTTS